MLGPLEVVDGDHTVALGGGRERAVLAVLLLHANAVVTRERLIEEVWGESAPATVSKNLQTYVWRLRRALAVDGLVVTSAGGYMLRLEVGRDEYDVARFERLVEEGRRALEMDQPERAERALSEALALWRGPPLVDFAYEAFAQAEIARLEELRLTAVEERIGADLRLGGHAGLVAQLETLMAAHPLRERLRGQLMLALYRCGRQSEALAAYRDGRERLVDELGLEPGPELQQLEQAILRQSPQLAAPARPVPFRGRGLPAVPNPTIGREDELAALAERLRTRSVRLLTLTGPGGVGKTRLALETARAVVGDFPDGAHFVSLSAVQRPEDVPAEIVRTLEIVVLAGEAPEQALERFLAAKQLLLVMDNFEHLLAAAPFIARLLSSCHALTVLATSREPLALQAEQRHAVRALAGADASVLFCERARAQNSAFDLDDANAEAVAQICRRVDGLPLGIEIAAARCALLSPSEIAERLPGALGAGSRDLSARQQTLRATIDWSHDLLNADERACFARFAVFSGSVTVDATEAITGADTTMLDQLVSKSLIARREVRGRTRLQMLETIREYAAERFASLPDREAVRERHYRYFLALSQRHANQRAVLGPKRLEHLAVLDDEVDNVHAALAWSARQSDGGLPLLELCEVFAEYWMMRERFAEAMGWIETALATPAAARHPALRVSLLRHKAWASWPLGRAAEQRALMAEAQRGAEAAADSALLVAVLADRAAQESLAGDLDTASAYADMAESHAEASGDRWAGAFAAWAKALAARHPAELRERVSQAAELLQAVGNAYLFAELHASAGHRALLLGADQDALEYCTAAVPLIRGLGSPYEWMFLQGTLGTAALVNGDAESARRAFSEQLHLCRELVSEPGAYLALYGFAAVAAARDDLDRAAYLYGAAATGRVPHDRIDARADALFAPARRRHGARTWDAAVRQGRALGLQDAIAYALGESDAPGADHAT